MKEINLIVDILFLESAKEKFNFPLNKSIRTSFWLPNSKISTFSEIIFENEKVELNKNYRAKIKLLERDFLRGKMLANSKFEVGSYPEKIAQGEIIKII